MAKKQKCNSQVNIVDIVIFLFLLNFFLSLLEILMLLKYKKFNLPLDSVLTFCLTDRQTDRQTDR